MGKTRQYALLVIYWIAEESIVDCACAAFLVGHKQSKSGWPNDGCQGILNDFKHVLLVFARKTVGASQETVNHSVVKILSNKKSTTNRLESPRHPSPSTCHAHMFNIQKVHFAFQIIKIIIISFLSLSLSFAECTLAPFVSGSTSEQIPFVFLPLRGQIIHPSKEISFQGEFNSQRRNKI